MRATRTLAIKHRAAGLLLAVLPVWFAAAVGAEPGRWSGYVAAELRLFPQQPLGSGQHGENLSLAFEPEFYRAWDGGRQSLTVVPFFRLDPGDDERTHADIRELTWLFVGEGWELRAGIRKVFWGVTEFLHLVDVINQTDFVENIDTEEKLGQPMLNLSISRGWGTLDFFVLPFFRERTFPGPDGRLRFLFPVDTDRARYESGVGRRHVDWAVRWFQTMGDWDMGLGHFSGTSREPRLLPDLSNPLDPILLPVYDLMDQTSLDLQATKGNWLWKLEVLTRRVLGERFTALTGGFEYTFIGLFGTAMDLGVLSEYLYDNRGDEAPPTPFEDDLAFGCRLVFNDVQSTEVLFGVVLDNGSQAQFWNLEGSRRLGSSWKLSVEARAFERVPPDDLFFGFRKDDYIQAELAWHF